MPDCGVDLVLISPGSRFRLYQSLGERLTAVENPVWAGLIASFVRRAGFSVAIIDAEAMELTPDRAAEEAVALKPRLVAVVVYGHQPSASTQNMIGASAVAKALKERAASIPLLLVGGHVAALPAQTLAEEPCDFVAADEGLHTIVGLLTAYGSGTDPDLPKIPGLVYRAGHRIAANAAAPLVTDLDREMPDGAWDLLPMSRYRAHNWHCFGDVPRQPYAALYTTLGCPYHCTFCCIQAPFKSGEAAAGLARSINSYRYWGPVRAVLEIERLVERYGVRNIKLADEMFVLNPRHVSDICDLLIPRRLDLNIWAYARVDTVRPALLDKMKAAGFTWLALGIEAADETVLRGSRKGYRVAATQETVRLIKSAGLNVIGNFIFGLPDDTLDTMNRTLELALELQCEFANFYCAMAYPGSALYDHARTNGWRLPGSWSGYSQHAPDTLPLPTKHVPAGEVLRFRDAAFERYFTHEPYLEMVRRRFGESTVAAIREMTSHRLSRIYATA
jgi:radical SAM superfamily enzyme YgiQ (UPF0313 family)